MRELDLARPGNPATVTKLDDRDPVLNVDLGPDGASVLFVTAKRVYGRAATGPVKLLADVADVHSLSISPDGAAQLWLADAGGAVLRGGKQPRFPAMTRSARFLSDGVPGVVLTTPDGVFTWDAAGAPKLVGGISPDDGVNISGDLAAGAAISFAYRKTGRQKEMQKPIAPAP
jgi:hypothetical protein